MSVQSEDLDVIGDELPPASDLMVPPGIARPEISPVVVGGEMEACGYVSSRYWTALPPGDFGTDKELKTSYKAITNIQGGMGSPIPTGKMNLTLDEWIMPDHVNCSRHVTCSLKEVVRTMRRFFLMLQRWQGQMRVERTTDHVNETTIKMQPAYAAAFTTAADAEYTQSSVSD